MPRRHPSFVHARRALARVPLRAGHRPLALVMALASGFGPLPVQAQPSGAQAVVGTATLTQQGSKLLVTTTNGPGAGHSAINWQSFSVPVGTSTWFAQPNAASTSINRVVGANPSAIFGTLGSNGRLVLVNPAGITVGAGAVVDTAGFTASTLRMTDADAAAGRLRFADGAAAALLKVDGQVLARSGDVVLIGRQVEVGAQAVVSSPQGATVLAAGQQAEVTGRGLEGIVFKLQAPTDRAVNLGRLSGDAVGVFAGTLRHSGVAQANAVSVEGGRIVLRASDTVVVSGQLQAQKADGAGGSIDALGNTVGLLSGAVLDTSNTAGGGQIRVGGGYQGQDASVPNAQVTAVESGVALRADATLHGDGGRIVVWSDDTTRAYGSFSVRGGAQGGHGGLVETSGKRYLDVAGAQVSAGAARGQLGTWLLDPDDLVVIHSESSPRPVNTDALFVPAGNGETSTVRDGQINAVLSGRDGANVILRTGTVSSTPAPVGSGDIRVRSGVVLGRQNAGVATLTLDAWRDIVFEAKGPGNTVQFQTTAMGDVDPAAKLVVNLKPGTGETGLVRVESGVEVDVGGAGAATALNVTGSGTVSVSAGGMLNLLPNTAMTAGRIDNAGSMALQTASITVTAPPSPDLGVVNNLGSIQLDKASSLSASTLSVGTYASLRASGQSSLVVGSLSNQGSVSLADSTLTVDSFSQSQPTPDGTPMPVSFQAGGSSSVTVLRSLSLGKSTSVGVWDSAALDVTQVDGALVLPSTVTISTLGSVALKAQAGDVQIGSDVRAGTLLVQASGNVNADGRNLSTALDGQALNLSAGGTVSFGHLGTTGGPVTVSGTKGISGGGIESSADSWSGATSVGDISLSSTGGSISVGDLRATGDSAIGPLDGGTVRITSAGSTRVGVVDVRGSGPGEGRGSGSAGGKIDIQSVGDVTADGDLLATGGYGYLGAAGAGGAVRITSTAGSVRLHKADASGNASYAKGLASSDGGLVQITAAQAVVADSLVANGGDTSVSPGGAGGQVVVAGATGVQVGDVSATGGRYGNPPGGGGLVSLASSAGNLVVTGTARAGSVRLDAAGDVQAADATFVSPSLNGQVQMTAGGQISFSGIGTNGGAVTLTAGGDITGRYLSTELGGTGGVRAGGVSVASAGGSVSLDELYLEGSVIDGVAKEAGSLVITASKDIQAGTLWMQGADNETGDGGRGGSALLSAGRNLKITGTVYAQGGTAWSGTAGAGGTVSLHAGSGNLTVADIVAQGGNGWIGAPGGQITLTSGGNIVAPATLDASGGPNADGGTVSLNAAGTVTAGSLRAGAGELGESDTGGRGGQILVQGAGGVSLDAADASSSQYASRRDVGGLVSLGSSGGSVQLNNSVRAGTIRLQAAQDVQAGAALLVSPDVDGLVTVSAGGAVDVGNVTTYGGDVSVTAAGQVHVGTVDTELVGPYGTRAGQATLASTGGSVTLDLAQMNGGFIGTSPTEAGALTVTAAKSIVVGTLYLSGASSEIGDGGAGGTVQLSAGDSVTVKNGIQVRGGHGWGGTGGAGGSVSLHAETGTVTLAHIDASAGGGGDGASGGSIRADAGTAVLANGALEAGGSGTGSGGSISLSSAGTVYAADLWAAGGSSEGGPIGAGGEIVLSGAAGVTLVTASAQGVRTAPGTHAGLVSLASSAGSVTLVGVAKAGTVRLRAAQDIRADGPQASIVSPDPDGVVELAADRAVQFNGITSSGGSVTVRAGGDVTGGSIWNRPWDSADVHPGSIAVESTGGSVDVSILDAAGNGPMAGGQILVTAAQGIRLDRVNASGTSNYSGGDGTAGGSVGLQAGKDVQIAGTLSASGGYGNTGGAGGSVQVRSTAGGVQVAAVDASGSGGSYGGAGGQIKLLAATQVKALGSIRADGGTGASGGSITLGSDGTVSVGEVHAVGGEASAMTEAGSGGQVRIAGTGGVTVDAVDAGGAPYSRPRGTGGLVSLSSSAGNVQLTGSARAGTVRMDAAGDLLVSPGVQITSPDHDGLVDLSSQHALQFGTIWSNGGTVTVVAGGDVSGRSVSAQLWDDAGAGAGSISVRSTAGKLDLGTLDASGGIFGATARPGGQVTLSAATSLAVGRVNVSGATNYGGGDGSAGGRILMRAGTDLTASDSLTAGGGHGNSHAGGTAGSITLQAGSGNLTVADISVEGGSGSSGAAGGAIRLEAGGNVRSKGTLDARGGTASGGGSVQISAGGTVGTNDILAHGGQSGEPGGSGGQVIITGASDLDIGKLDATGNPYSNPVGTGGLASLVSTGGNVRLGSSLSAGTVRVRAAGDLVSAKESSVWSPDADGIIDLVAGGLLQFNSVNSNGGTVLLQAGGDIAGSEINAWVRRPPTARAGSISVNSSGGNVTLGSLSAVGQLFGHLAGQGGEIAVTAAKSLTVNSADVSGAGNYDVGDGASGGRMLLSAGESLTVNGGLYARGGYGSSDAAGAGGGSVSLHAGTGSINLQGVEAWGGNGLTGGAGGQVRADAGGSIVAVSSLNASGAVGGQGGLIQLSAGGTVTANGLSTLGGHNSTGTGGRGGQVLVSGDAGVNVSDVDAGANLYSAVRGTGGLVSLVSSGGDIAVVRDVRAGTVRVQAAGDLLAGKSGAFSSADATGLIDLSAGGRLQFASIDSNGGTVQVHSVGAIEGGPINAQLRSATAERSGSITVRSTAGQVTLGRLEAQGNSFEGGLVEAGQISVSAAQGLQVESIEASGAGSEGSDGRSGGTVALTAGGDVRITGGIHLDGSAGGYGNQGGAGGSLNVRSTGGALTVGDIQARGGDGKVGGKGGTVLLQAATDVQAPGTLNVSAGSFSGSGGTVGAGGTLGIQAGGLVQAGTLQASGGEISVAAGSSLTLGSADVSGVRNDGGGDGSAGGRMLLSAVDSLTVTGNLYAYGGYGTSEGVGAGGGSVSLHAGSGGISLQGILVTGGSGRTGGAGGQLRADTSGSIVAASSLDVSGAVAGQGGLIQLSAGGTVTANGLSALGGHNSTGTGGPGGQVLVSGDAGVNVSDVDAGANLYSAVRGTGGLVSLVSSGGDIAVVRDVRAGTVRVQAAGDLLAGKSGAFSSADATGLIDLSAGGRLQFASIDSNGGTVQVHSVGAIEGGPINAQLRSATADRSGSITVRSTAGQVTLGRLEAQGNSFEGGLVEAGQISVTAAQGLQVESIEASGAGSDSANGRDGGTVTLTAGGDVRVTGGISLGGGYGNQAGAGGTLNVRSTGGAVTVGGVQASGGGGVVGGKGGTVLLQAATDIQAPATLNVSGGSSSGSGAAGGAGGTLGLEAGGRVAATYLQANGGDNGSGAAGVGGRVTVLGDAGVTLGTAEVVGSFNGTGPGLGGAVSLDSAAGDVQVTGRVWSGAVQIRAGASGIDASSASLWATDPAGGVDLSTTGALNFNAISASGGTVRLQAAGDITGGQVSTTGDWGTATSAGTLSVRSTAGQVSIDGLSLQAVVKGGVAQAAGQASVEAARSIRLGTVYAGGTSSETGQGSAGGAVTLAAGGDVKVDDQIYANAGQGAAGGAIRITAGGTVTAGGLQASGGYAGRGTGGNGGEIVVAGDTGLDLGYVGAGGNTDSMVRGTGGLVSLSSSAGDIKLSSAVNAGTVRVRAAGDITASEAWTSFSSQDPGGLVDVAAAGRLTFSAIDSNGGRVLLQAGGDVQGGSIDARLRSGPGTLPGSVSVASTGGSVRLGELNVSGTMLSSGVVNAGTVQVAAAGDLSLTSVYAYGAGDGAGDASNGGVMSLSAGGTLHVGGVLDANGGNGPGGTAGSGGSIGVQSRAGSVELGEVRANGGWGMTNGAGGTIAVDAAGQVTASGTVQARGGSFLGSTGAAGSITIQGGQGVNLATVLADLGRGGQVSIASSGGWVNLSGGVGGGSLRIVAAGNVQAADQDLVASDADGTLQVSAGGTVSFSRIQTQGGAATVEGAQGVTGYSVSTTPGAGVGVGVGSLSVGSSAGSVDIRSLNASAGDTSVGAVPPGSISVTAANAIRLGQASADGLGYASGTPGGVITLTAGAGGIQVDGTLSAAGGLLADGGRVSLSAPGPITVGTVNVDAGSGSSAAGRSAGPSLMMVSSASAAAGQGGAVTVLSSGAVRIGSIQASGGSAADVGVTGGAGGQVNITGQAVTLGNLSALGGTGGDYSVATGGVGGQVQVSASTLALGSIDVTGGQAAFGGTGGSVSLSTSAGSITADAIQAGGGYGGTSGGTGGTIALSATGGTITVPSLTVQAGESGFGSSDKFIAEPSLFAAATTTTPTDPAGQVTLRATAVNGVGGDINVTNPINVTGATQGGTVDIQGDGSVTVAGVDARALNAPDHGGSVRIAGGQGVTFGALDVGVSGSGRVDLASSAGSLVQSAGTTITAPQLTLAAAGTADLSQNTNHVRNLTANVGGALSLLNTGPLTLTGAGVQAGSVSLNLQEPSATLDQAPGAALTTGSLAVVASAVNLDNVTLGSTGSPGVVAAQVSSGNFQLTNVGTAPVVVGSIGTLTGITATGDPAATDSGRVVLQTAGPLEIRAPITSDAPAGSNAIVLVASSVRMGPGGSLNALNDRWAFFLDDPATSDFANMPVSGNLAVWGRTFDGSLGTSLPETGNRYAFKFQPQVTISLPTPLSKTYDGNASFTGVPTPTVTGIPQAADYGNVFLQDVITVTMDTQVASKNVGTYALGATVSTLPTGYRNTVNLAQATIDKATLSASIVGTPTRAYDGTLDATLAAINFKLDGFVSGEGASVGKTTGRYDSKDVPTASKVSTSLAAGDFTADVGTLLSNYTLPTTASGAGAITKATLTASITGTPTKVYDGSTAAALTGANYKLTGFVGSESAGVSQASGAYNSKDVVSANTVTATLAAADFTAGAATLLDNYALPTTASGAGAITTATLGASIVGTPTRAYDGSTNAMLTAGNYKLTGFVSGESATVKQTAGTYNAKDVATATQVSTSLSAGDFAADGATLLSNYTLPTRASGAGAITRATLTASITGTPTKVYDGTVDAALTGSNYKLTGFVTGEDASVGRTTGAYNSKDVVTASTVSTTLAAADFTAKSGTLLENYTLPTTASGAGAITKATLSADIVNTPTKTYDGSTAATLTNANYKLTGFVGTELAKVTQTVGTYNSKDVVTASTVTASLAAGDFTAGGATLLSNYTLPTTASGAGAITKAALSADIVKTPSKVYDGSTVATLTNGNFSLGGFVSGESANVTQTVGAYNSKDVVSATTVTASLAAGDFTANGATLLSNYALPTTASGAGAITKATLSADIVNTPTKVYDGSTTATLTNANYKLTGFVGTELAKVTQTVGTYNSKDVVTASTVTASLAAGDFTADGATLLSNYTLPTTASGAGAITKATLSADIVKTPTKVYDGFTAATLANTNYKLTGFVGTESANVTQTVGTYNSKDVVSATTVTANLAAGDFTANGATLLSNYTLPNTASGAGAITKATLSADIVNTPTKTYDGSTTATLTNADYKLTGFVGTELAKVTQTVGTYNSKDVVTASTVTASLAAGDFTADGATLLSNYSLPTTASGAGAITKATLSADIVNTPTKTYDGSTTATLTNANYKLAGFVGTELAKVTQTVGAYNSKDVVTASTVTASLAAGDFTADGATLLSNYTLPTTASGAGAITKATLSADIVNTPTKVYDGSAAATLVNTNYKLTGFVGTESVNVTQTAGTYNSKDVVTATTVTASLAAGDFTANGATLLSNYTLPTTASGAGAITKATLSADIVKTPTKVYDGSTAAALTSGNFSLGGFVSGESANVTQTVGAYNSKDVVSATTVTAQLAAGDFTANGATLLSNYSLPTTASGAGAITKAALSADIVKTPTKVYDGSTAATLAGTNYKLTGFVGTESANVTQTVGTYNSKDVVTASTVTAQLAAGDFTANGATLLSNYTLPTAASGAGTITPATVTAAIVGAPGKTYDGTTHAVLASANFDLRGLVIGESVTVGKTSGSYNSKDVATASSVTTSLAAGDFTGNGNTLLSNYVLPVQASGAGSIARATLTAAIAGTPTKVYDGTTAATLQPANVALSGFAPNEGASVTRSSGSYDSKDVLKAGTVTTTLVAGDFAPSPGTLLANYLLPTQASGAGKITPAPLKVAALDQNKLAGEVLALTGQEIQVTGLKGTETVASAVLASTGTPADAATGAYVITAKGPLAGGSGFQADNYLVTYLPGVLTVSAVPSALQQVNNQVTTLNKLIVEEAKAQEDGTSLASNKRKGQPNIVQTSTACTPASN